MTGNLTVYTDLDQRTPEWYEARAGMVTASTIARLITPTLKVANNDTARGLLTTLAAERITGHVEETPMNTDMIRGVEHEPFARDAYTEHTGHTVTEVGFIVRTHPTITTTYNIGYSPDGLVGDDGLIEIKCPRQKGHVTTILSGEIPAQYMAQCQTGLLVSGRDWLDYVSFVGGMPLFVKRVTPDAAWQAAIHAAAEAAEITIADLTERYEAATKGMPTTDPVLDLDEITI